MIFWICVIALVIGIFLYWKDEEGIGSLLVVCGAIIAAIMLAFIVINGVTAKGEKALYEERYKALLYKSQTEAIRDEFGIVNKEYIDEVQAWNEDIAMHKEWQRDFWIGILFPNIYDDFETIDLESIQYVE